MKPYGKIFNPSGYANLAESGDRPIKAKDKKERERRNAVKEICLNCTRKKCSGHCEKFPW